MSTPASTTAPTSSRPHLVPPELAARVPIVRRAAVVALIIGALSAVAIVVQAVALATAIDRSLLHHVPLAAVRPELITVAVALVARAVLALVGELSSHRTAGTVARTLRGQLLRHTLTLGPSWLAGERPGELSLTATRGLRSLDSYFARYVPQAALAAVVPVVLLVWVATQDWLSLLVVVGLVIAVPITMIYFGREANRRTERQWRRLASLAGRFLQLIEGLATLRAFGREGHGRREVEASAEGVRVATMRTLRVAFLSALAMDLIAGFGVGFVAMVLGLRLLWGELSLQTAMAVLLVAPEIFLPLRRAGAEFHASTEGQAAAARVLDVLDLPLPASPPASDPHPAPAPARPGAPPGRVGLRINSLRVDYENRAGPALSECTLVAPPGVRIALVGPSGSGKSSVLAALLRFVVPTAGRLSLDGVGSDDWDVAAWRGHFSWVPQRPHLFTATLADNLRLGAPEATDEAVHAVLRAVGLDELTSHLPRGIATTLGQDGLTLSAGERQRVALARALIRPAPILLFDEPTAALDAPTASLIAGAIDPFLDGRTVIVAAHEPLLLRHFDQVLELGGAHPTVAVP
jgi:thiol reductant ABC exporter CydD subunit